MLNWDDLRFLLAVARSGSMSGAARELDVNHATVIRRIRSLEEQLGTTLFERHGHSYVITPAGQVAFDAAERMEAQSVGVERQVIGQATALSGRIRVTAPEPMGRTFLLPAIREFNQVYPDILIDLSLSMRSYDLGMREADVAFRVTDNPPQDLVGNKLATIELAVYGRRGDELDPARVSGVISIEHLLQERVAWEEAWFPEARTTLVTDSPAVAADAIKEGFGVSMIPTAIGEPDPELERLPDIPVQANGEIWLLTHLDIRSNARMRVFRDFIQEYFSKRVPEIMGADIPEHRPRRQSA
ncbi:MAG: LysR family transcriptional regulator [Halieaceae bacterium]|nr:LysR family transcriptional regulator [Halieaceae bacterium]